VKTRNSKKSYVKPRIVSEKVFERVALACAGTAMNPGSGLGNLKNSLTGCDFSHS